MTPTHIDGGVFLVPFYAQLTLTNVSLPVPEAGAAVLVGCVGLVGLWVRRR